MRECSICFDGFKNGVKCFGSCSLVICIGCFNKILNINRVEQIEYCCPQCRHTSIKNEDKTFTKYVSNNKKCLRRIVFLLENHIDNESKRMLENTWEQFTLNLDEHIHEHLINLTPYQLLELTGGDYDNVPT
jgi:uncharacterized protein (DUF2225 family)